MKLHNPNAQAIVNATRWRRELAKALSSRDPLHRISASHLRDTITRLRYSPDPDAWIWQTVAGAELKRRAARLQETPTQTATELAWHESQRATA